MLNKKVILLSGYSRGGTNILWNILQSHPAICSARYETHSIFNDKKLLLGRGIKILRALNVVDSNVSRRIIDYGLYRIKMTNYRHGKNKYISPNTIYSKKQVAASALCLKSVDKDIRYTEDLLKVYPELYFIGLSRNGYAIAEGHLRRGMEIEDIAKMYQSVADKIKFYSETHRNFKLIKFEEILKNPFDKSTELFQFTKAEPYSIEYIRLKSKKKIQEDGSHNVLFGEENNKYWFDRSNITGKLDPSVNERQVRNLSAQHLKSFNKYAESALRFFGYEIL